MLMPELWSCKPRGVSSASELLSVPPFLLTYKLAPNLIPFMEQTLHLCIACRRLLSAGLCDLQVVRVRFKFQLNGCDFVSGWGSGGFLITWLSPSAQHNFVVQNMFLEIWDVSYTLSVCCPLTRIIQGVCSASVCHASQSGYVTGNGFFQSTLGLRFFLFLPGKEFQWLC